MKAAKFIVETDHMAGYHGKDKRISMESTTILDAMEEAASILKDEEDLYCSTIYQLVPGTRGKEYRPILRNFGHGGFYTPKAGSWTPNYKLIREGELYGVEFNW